MSDCPQKVFPGVQYTVLLATVWGSLLSNSAQRDKRRTKAYGFFSSRKLPKRILCSVGHQSNAFSVSTRLKKQLQSI